MNLRLTLEEAAGSPTYLFGVSVVAIVGLFSSFVVFTSLLQEGAAKLQGKSQYNKVVSVHLGPLEEGR